MYDFKGINLKQFEQNSNYILKIGLEGFEIFAIIGILESERICRQKILIDCEIEYIYEKEFLNYVLVKDAIQRLIEEKKYFLIEEALVDISANLKNEFDKITSLKLKISKPQILENTVVYALLEIKY